MSAQEHISTIPSVDSLGKIEQTHSQNMYILQVECLDRVGLLHDVTLALWELQLTVHRAHVTTSVSYTHLTLPTTPYV